MTDHGGDGGRPDEGATTPRDLRFEALVENASDGLIVLDATAHITYASPSISQVVAGGAADLRGLASFDLIHPDDRNRVAEWMLPVLEAPGSVAVTEFRNQTSGGEWRWIEVSARNLLEHPDVRGIVLNLRDVTRRHHAENQSTRLLEIFDLTEDIVTIAGLDGRSVYLNRAGREFWDFAPDDDLTDVELLERAPAWVKHRLLTEIGEELLTSGVWSGELAITRPDGTVVPVSAQLLGHRNQHGEVEQFSTVLRDISERKAFEDRLEHQATHDPLTALPNRMLLLDRLEVALARGRRHNTGVAVLFLDVDHFKVINDSLGHRLGDRILVELGRRLRVALRPGDTVARFGGDEFVVLCEDLDGEEAAISVAERISEAVTGTMSFDGTEVYLAVSMGIAYTPTCEEEAEPLLRDADAAMYRAKDRGRDRFEFFDQEMRAHVLERLEIESSLRRALERHELRVFYQPKVDLGTGHIVGVESLIRWEHPERGLLPPGAFIGVAEETGLIVPIGLWVLEHSCRQVLRWQAERPTLGALNVAVNLSGRQLTHPDLVQDIAEILRSTGIDPKQVELEVTESVLMDDVEASAVTLNELRDLSVHLSVDDFGTGYSSLAYLRRFPVDKLKVDRSFVSGLGEDESDSAIVAAVINLAHTLGLEAVAEGVETPEQLAGLRSLGCDLAQGFYMSRPVPSEQLGELLDTNPHW